jgi:ribosomal protein S18 acetylase RimI-like enzyme
MDPPLIRNRYQSPNALPILMPKHGCRVDLMEDGSVLDSHGQELMDLFQASFFFMMPPEQFRRIWRADARLHGPIGTYAIDRGGRLVGFAGIARRPLTARGKAVKSGHMWVICVRADMTRRGLGRELVVAAIDQLESEGCKAITLHTTTGLVAYDLYKDLGFRDLHRLSFWRAFPPAGAPAPELRPLEEAEARGVAEVYTRALKGHDGFLPRGGDPLAVYEAWGARDRSWYTTIDPPGELRGYVCMSPKPTGGVLNVMEIAGPDRKWYASAMEQVVRAGAGVATIIRQMNPVARRAFEGAGFEWVDVGSHERLMARGRALVPPKELVAGRPGKWVESRYDIF